MPADEKCSLEMCIRDSRKDGVIKGYKNTLITDLPGIYSMSPYSSEEIVTREFLLNEKPKMCIRDSVGIVSGLVGAYIIKRVQKRGVVPN